jgi:hypothetical protein
MKKLLLGVLLALLVEIGDAQSLICSQALMQISNDSLLKTLQELVGKSPVIIDNTPQYISSRYAFHPSNILAAKYLENTCSFYGYSIRKMDYSGTGTNIIAEKRGTTFPEKSIMICAHYDCVGGNITSFQGADDNASGVAALIEAARVLKNIDFPYTIQLAFWDEEELGLLGSKSYPSSGGNLPQIVCVINLDMIAWDGDNDSLAMIHVIPKLQNTIGYGEYLKNLAFQHKLKLQCFIKNPGEPNTDQQSFWDKDINAIGLTEDYDRDFNPNWHRYSDSIENINLKYFYEMSKFAIMGLCEFSITGATGLGSAIEKENSFKLFPNPNNKVLNFRFEPKFAPEKLELCQANGILVWEKNLVQNEINSIELPQELPNGFYFCKVFFKGDFVKIFKLIVE